MCVVLCSLVIIWSASLPATAGLFPKVVSAFMIVFGCVGLAHQMLVLRGHGAGSHATRIAIWNPNTALRRELRLLPPTLIAVSYVYFFRKLGFVWLTPLLIFATSWVLGYRKAWVLIAVAVGFSAVLYLAFRILLSVPFPTSPLLGI